MMIMKSILLNLFVLLSVLISCSSSEQKDDPRPDPEPPQEITIKAMTYNIWGVRGLTMEDMEAMAEVIKEVDPDIIALQEVDELTTRNPMQITKIMAELTGMEHYWFAKAMDYQGGQYGEAILSKLPFKEKKLYTLGTTPQLPGEPRAVAQVTIEKEGKEFYFIGTHLDHLGNEANRLKQTRDIVDILKTHEKPVILVGDLNLKPDSESMAILQEHLSLGCFNNNCLPTYPSPVKPEQEPRTLDYLMYAPSNAFTVQSYQVYQRAGSASDHYPVVATFRLDF